MKKMNKKANKKIKKLRKMRARGGCRGQGGPHQQPSLEFIFRGKVKILFLEKGTSLERIFQGWRKV